MQEQLSELQRDMTKVKRILYGPEDEPYKGMVHQHHEHHEFLEALKSKIDKMIWLLVLGVIGAILNLVMPRAAVGGGASNHSTMISTSSEDKSSALNEEAARRRGYYLSSEVAAILKKSERSVTDMCARGDIPDAFQPEGGRGWRIPLGFLLGAAREDEPGGRYPQISAASSKHPQPAPDDDP